MDTRSIIALSNHHCELGENPLWNEDNGCIYWEDIDAGKVHRLELATGIHQLIYSGPKVGGFTFQENGDLLLFRINDLALLHPDGVVEVFKEYSDEGMERFNDVIADPEGRVYAGTIGKTAESGGLYRVDRDGSITSLWRGSGCSNGMGFTPDLKEFYWTCSTTRRIYKMPYNRESGQMGEKQIFYQADDQEGITDGMTVDREGHVWSTRWDGYAVVHHGPDGRVLERMRFPVAKVTSVCFGGVNLDQLFVTTAGGAAGAATADGTLYQMAVKAQGRPEFRSRIGL